MQEARDSIITVVGQSIIITSASFKSSTKLQYLITLILVKFEFFIKSSIGFAILSL